MAVVNLVKQIEVSRSGRARQVEALFDIPPAKKAKSEWHGTVPLEERDWNIGLIVGPSGSGKTSVAMELFGNAFHPPMEWNAKSVIDDFSPKIKIDTIAAACSSVGFNTMPAWLRPYAVLSNGERFRVELARRLLELPDPVVVDEFTSVVDRQVAQIGSHAVAKFVRKAGRRFVAVSCHYDIEEWLQPDWVLEPSTMSFRWRSLRRRPSLEVEICRVKYPLWHLFAPYHYLSAELNTSAKCFALFVGERPAVFLAVLHFPHGHVHNLKKISRVVTLPDWQGLGLAFIAMEEVTSAYRALGYRCSIHPAHPSFVRAFDRSRNWVMRSAPAKSMFNRPGKTSGLKDMFKGRPSATFEYVGPAMERLDAQRLLA